MNIARRLELNERKFSVFTAVGDNELYELWTALLHVAIDKVSTKDLPLELGNFISHCCKWRHYFSTS